MSNKHGRLPLPVSVTGLTARDVPALANADSFIDRLGELSLERWLEIGRTLIHGRGKWSARRTAWAIVDATLSHRGLEIAAWYVRDAVETVAYLATAARRLAAEERRAFAAAHGAAEETALALLAREFLPDEDIALLTAPFDGLA